MSLTTPTTVIQGSDVPRPTRSRRPTGSAAGQCWRASVSLTMTTRGESRVSDSLKSRPARMRIPIVPKYPGVTI